MKNPSPSSTHRARATDPECFRAIATGIGQTLQASEYTGEARKRRVRETAGTRSTIDMAPPAEGFGRDPDDMAFGLQPPSPMVMAGYPERTWRR